MSEERMLTGFDAAGPGHDRTAFIVERPTALEREVIRAARYFIEMDRSYRGRWTLGTRIAVERLRTAVERLDDTPPAVEAGIPAREEIVDLRRLSFVVGFVLGMAAVVLMHVTGFVP